MTGWKKKKPPSGGGQESGKENTAYKLYEKREGKSMDGRENYFSYCDVCGKETPEKELKPLGSLLVCGECFDNEEEWRVIWPYSEEEYLEPEYSLI